MKVKFIPALILFSFLAFYCCKTVRPVSAADEQVSTDEISDYLHSSNVSMRNSNTVYGVNNVRVSGDSVFGKPVSKKQKQKRANSIQLFTEKNLNAADTNAQGELFLSKKEIRRATVSGLAQKIKNSDDEPSGLAIGLAILIFLLIILIVVGLIYLLIASLNNSSNNAGTSNSGGSNSNGCYVATMVYGDYDAPEVLVLRRFRDQTLSRSAAGRAFIRWYYGWSPGFVKKYNHLTWLHRSIRFVLDRLVKLLS